MIGAGDAVRALRRTTLGRSARANLRWVGQAVGWGSVAYLVAWSLVLVIAALEVVEPLTAVAADLALRWAAPVAAALIAFAALVGARERVTPLWLDRRDLAHLLPSPADAATLLGWPVVRALVPTLGLGLAVGAIVALLAPRLLPIAPATAASALLSAPSLALLLLTLRWRAAWRGGPDVATTLVWIAATAASLAALAGTVLGHGAWATSAAALLTAPLTPLDPATAWTVAALHLAAATGLALWTRRGLNDAAVPPRVVQQSEVLAELRAITMLRALSALQALPADPGARFAAARARSLLGERPWSRGPRVRPPVPRMGGATLPFVWLALVRLGRRSPWSLLALPLVAAAAGAAAAAFPPFGGGALVPCLAFAWACAQLHPGRVGWPGFAVDVRGRSFALGLLAGTLGVLAALGGDLVAALQGWPPPVDGWLMLPLGLASAALIDLLAGRSGDPRTLDVWVSVGLLTAVPAALLGWSGVEVGIAAPVAGGVWLLVAWLRSITTARLG